MINTRIGTSMRECEGTLRAQSLTLLHNIQGWMIGEQIRQLMAEVKTIAQQENVVSALERIHQAMLDSNRVMQRIADVHRLVFVQQMRGLGVNNLVSQEPYLEGMIAQYRLEYLRALEKLFERVNALLEVKSIDPTAPILSEVEKELGMIEARAADRLGHALDEARQRSNGVHRYRWVTAGDERVRPTHAAREGQIFDWENGDIKPGEEFGCRCVAEPVANDNGEYQVAVLPAIVWTGYEAYVLGGAIIAAAGAEVARRQAEQGGVLSNEDATPEKTPASTDKPSSTPSGNKEPEKDPKDKFKRPEGVPDHWEEKPSDKGEGKKWVDPENSGNDVRVQKGNPDVSNPSQQEDYVRWKKDGKWLDKDGNVVSREDPSGHISPEDFKFDPRIFK